MKYKLYRALMGVVIVAATFPSVAFSAIPRAEREPASLEVQHLAIESSRVEVQFSLSGAVLQILLCERESSCLRPIRLLPARDIRFYLGTDSIDPVRATSLSGRSGGVLMDRSTKLVKEVRFSALEQEGGHD